MNPVLAHSAAKQTTNYTVVLACCK